MTDPLNDDDYTGNDEMGRAPGPLLELSAEEKRSLLSLAEESCERIISNRLGGLSGINRPFYLAGKFTEVIEKYGRRDTGYYHSKTTIDMHKETAAERDQLREALKGAHRIAQIASEEIARLKAGNVTLLESLEDVLSDYPDENPWPNQTHGTILFEWANVEKARAAIENHKTKGEG